MRCLPLLSNSRHHALAGSNALPRTQPTRAATIEVAVSDQSICDWQGSPAEELNKLLNIG